MPARVFNSLSELQAAGTRGWRARRDRARDRQEWKRSEERIEANRQRQAIINEIDRRQPFNEAVARRERAVEEVDHITRLVAGYERQAIDTGRVTDSHVRTLARLEVARSLLASAEAAVVAEMEKLGDKAPVDEKGAAR